MEIYLIRHTTPDVAKGICYGQADLDVAASFSDEATAIRSYLPAAPAAVYSSPLQRCQKLAVFLFPGQVVQQEPDLKELDFGNWELQAWNEIAQADLQAWMDNFVEAIVPGGESYSALAARSVHVFKKIKAGALPAVVIAHGGVLRSILAHISGISLQDSFQAFEVPYGCVLKISQSNNKFDYQLLYKP